MHGLPFKDGNRSVREGGRKWSWEQNQELKIYNIIFHEIHRPNHVPLPFDSLRWICCRRKSRYKDEFTYYVETLVEGKTRTIFDLTIIKRNEINNIYASVSWAWTYSLIYVFFWNLTYLSRKHLLEDTGKSQHDRWVTNLWRCRQRQHGHGYLGGSRPIQPKLS